MAANTAETLSRGMAILTEKLGIVEAENFIFLVKAEEFDYTEWQRNFFGNKTKEELDTEMDIYFDEHPYNRDSSKLL